MSNPFSSLINSALKLRFNQAIDAVMEDCEVPVRLYFPITKFNNCTSCGETISGGSPNPFIAGNKGKPTTLCPVCGGSGKIPIENYEDLNLCVMWDYNKNREIVPGIAMTTAGEVRTFSKMSTIKSVKTCKYAIFNINIEYTNNHKFQRKGEPSPMGFGDDAYILTYWTTLE